MSEDFLKIEAATRSLRISVLVSNLHLKRDLLCFVFNYALCFIVIYTDNYDIHVKSKERSHKTRAKL